MISFRIKIYSYNIMNCLDLFSGTHSFAKCCKELGHNCLTLDRDLPADINIDIMDWDYKSFKPNEFDIIWASPPCTCYSVASISTHWTGGHRAYIPKTKEAEESMKFVDHMSWIINLLNPRYYYIENPRGVLRKLDVMNKSRWLDIPLRHTVWYCQYGDKRAKPTDIWTNDNNWNPKPVCKNGNPDCHHERAPRGSKTGTQGLKNNYERSKVPEELCEEIIKGIK